jgi:pimeloyl-ACP methyl ester carboxylesterase
MGEEMLLNVLDSLSVPLVVGIGEGAGANILARFGLAYPQRVLGLILIHLVSTGVGFLETLKERFLGKRRNSQQMSSVEIVAMHKMGKEFSSEETSKHLYDKYQQRVQTLNGKNLRKYVNAYMNRKEIHDLKELDVLLVCGGKSLFSSGVESIYSKCNKTKTSLLKIDGITDIMT